MSDLYVRKLLRFVMLMAALCLPLTAANARADSPEYAKLLRDGVQEFGLGNFGEARLLFSRAHEITPTARTFRGLGLCDYELRHYASAIDELEAALNDSRRPLTPELRSQVEPVLERAREYVGRFRLRVPGPVTSMIVDGKTRPFPADNELLLDPGTHNLEIVPRGGAPIQRELNVEVGARDEIAFVPAPVEAPAAPPLEVQPAAAEPIVKPVVQPVVQPVFKPQPTAASHPRVFTWVAAGLTGVFGAGIVGFGLSAQAKNHTFKDQARMGVVPDPQLQSSGELYETLTNVSIIGCALSAAATITLFFVEGDHASAEPAVQAGLTPTGAYVSGRF